MSAIFQSHFIHLHIFKTLFYVNYVFFLTDHFENAKTGFHHVSKQITQRNDGFTSVQLTIQTNYKHIEILTHNISHFEQFVWLQHEFQTRSRCLLIMGTHLEIHRTIRHTSEWVVNPIHACKLDQFVYVSENAKQIDGSSIIASGVQQGRIRVYIFQIRRNRFTFSFRRTFFCRFCGRVKWDFSALLFFFFVVSCIIYFLGDTDTFGYCVCV